MIAVVAAFALAGPLVTAAGLKLADPVGTRAALATYGLRGRAARLAWASAIVVELGVAAGVALGRDTAAYAGAALLLAFALAQLGALAHGRAGAPCACFGARGRVSQRSFTRTLLLAAGLAALPLLPRTTLEAKGWLTVGLVAGLLGLATLGVVVLALARELGSSGLGVEPGGGLTLNHTGPAVGSRTRLVEAFSTLAPDQLGLAIFTAEGCGLCRALAPAIDQLSQDPKLALTAFDERADAGAWAVASVPGSPFAVVLDGDGIVLAQGTPESQPQLESLVAAALRRRDESPTAARA